uniref:Small hydrophobic protein n=1 Tax=Human respiratory syncytial virus A TaxID=208893 RepID=A0A384ZFE9_HSRVX|nr:small hydrophobic protein [Human respiratory syncytial virus A]AWO13016.1 small hydrophobic protein [Human respiratory syncytial virus A]AWO13071.1 small hydrophobic protein [Human respiratory syncytial virus A]AWO13312.1 small hydrophobic protein [Human respiratory syncytial virus A]AWO13356.1 small hydrophobic protein [Human respiratory syncytial virus A]
MENTSITIEFSSKFWPYFTLIYMITTIISLIIIISIMIAILNKLCEYNVFLNKTFELPRARINT